MIDLPRPVFFDSDPDKILSECIDVYEKETKKKLYPAQPAMLDVKVMSYMLSLFYQRAQEALEQNFAAWARDIALDNLAYNQGTSRLPIRPSKCLVEVNLAAPAAEEITLMPGIQLETSSGIVFITSQPLFFSSGQTQATAEATAEISGNSGNGYIPGSLSLVSPNSQIISATNITQTADGADIEEDDRLRERIPETREALSRFGNIGSYKANAKEFHQSIKSVHVDSSSPGKVEIYILSAAGVPSQALLNDIYDYLKPDEKRPDSDQLSVLPAEAVNIDITAEITLKKNIIPEFTKQQLFKNISDYTAKMKSNFGLDVVVKKIEELLNAPAGVYEAVLTSPSVNISVSPKQFVNIVSFTPIYKEPKDEQ